MEMFAYRLYLPLYRVADRYQADEAVSIEHRHMAEFAFRHAIHNGVERIVHVAGGDVTRHHLRNRQLQSSTSDIRHRAHNVALRQNADETPAGVEDHQRTDAMRGEQLRRRRQIGCRLDADDVVALGAKNGLQTHARLRQADFVPILWSGKRRVYRSKNVTVGCPADAVESTAQCTSASPLSGHVFNATERSASCHNRRHPTDRFRSAARSIRGYSRR